MQFYVAFQPKTILKENTFNFLFYHKYPGTEKGYHLSLLLFPEKYNLCPKNFNMFELQGFSIINILTENSFKYIRIDDSAI